MSTSSTSSQISSYLDRLQKLSSTLTPLEQENVAFDLQFMVEYAEKGLYSETEFIGRQHDDVGRRTAEFMRYLEGFHHISDLWYELLKSVKLTSEMNVIDLLPGWAPKVEIALARHNFTGEVALLDTDLASLEKLETVLRFFHPQFAVKKLVSELLVLPNDPQYDLVTTNHFLDDYLLNTWAEKSGQHIQELYRDAELFKTATQELMSGKSPELMFLARHITSLMKPEGTLLVVHYRSVFEQAKSLTNWYEYCLAQYAELMACFKQLGFSVEAIPVHQKLVYKLRKN